MKQLRELIYKTLVDKFDIAPSLMSRIEGNDPLVIQLKGGVEIYVNLQEGVVQLLVEIPVLDRRIVRNKAAQIFDSLIADEGIFLNIQKDKLFLVCEFSVESCDAERVLADKLLTLNSVVTAARS
ncbi:hypothetical protein [Shewanella waksmanii]|uniref:hypothetical protein n=1 Tax=Shewanella waksmanii TaxID=213783 RepID=UPI0037362AE9